MRRSVGLAVGAGVLAVAGCANFFPNPDNIVPPSAFLGFDIGRLEDYLALQPAPPG